MSSVFIYFKDNREELEANAKKLDRNLKDTISNFKENTAEASQRTTQDFSNLLRDVDLKTNIKKEIIQSEVDNLTEQAARLTKSIENSDKRRVYAKQKMAELADIQNILNNKQNELKQSVDQTEAKVMTLRQQVRLIGAGLSAASGFLSLYYALSGSVQDQMISTGLSLLHASVSMALAYGTIGAASGNIALIAAAGSLASSAANIINTVNAVGERARMQREAEERRLQNLRKW